MFWSTVYFNSYKIYVHVWRKEKKDSLKVKYFNAVTQESVSVHATASKKVLLFSNDDIFETDNEELNTESCVRYMTPANVLGMFSCSISRRVACVPTDQVEMCENSAKVPLSDEILQLDSADNNDDIVYFVSSQACSDRHAAPFDHSTELLINLHNFHDELQRAATAAKPEGSFESGIVVKVQELCLFLKAMVIKSPAVWTPAVFISRYSSNWCVQYQTIFSKFSTNFSSCPSH